CARLVRARRTKPQPLHGRARARVVRGDRGARPYHQVPGALMATGGNAIRGTRVGAGPMGEQDHGFHAERIAVSYWDALGNETVGYFAAGIPEDEIPEVIDSPHSGLPAGRDKNNPPAVAKTEPYKTHLAYVKERRTEEEAEALLEDALRQLRERRGLE